MTEQDAQAVAAHVGRGMPIHLALRLVNAAFTLPQWNESLSRDTILARHYELKLAEAVKGTLDMLPGRTMKTLPAELWALSRGPLREHFVEGKSGGGNSTTFNGPVQINVGSAKAARALLRKVSYPPAEPKQVKGE